PFVSETVAEARAFIVTAKQQAVKEENEAAAKHLWCLDQTLKAHQQYCKVFHLLKTARFYDAWCELERLELTLQFLRSHFSTSFSTYHLDFIATHCRRWQSLFPYKIFMSPEF